MKTIFKLSFLFLALAWTACQNNPDEVIAPDDAITSVDDIRIVDGMIANPQWLVHKMDSIADRYMPLPDGGKLYPLVYSFRYEEQDYIYLIDFPSSFMGYNFFTLSGAPVDLEMKVASDWYNALMEAVRENGTLIWSASMKQASTRGYSLTTIYTPNNTLIQNAVYLNDEYTSAEKAAVMNQLYKEFPKASTTPNSYATILSDPTTTYNCHAYAWRVSEGGSPVWIDYMPMAYVQDGTYNAVSSHSPNVRVRYLSDDHSAIAETPNVFVSKWGRWPLMRHSKNTARIMYPV